MSERKAFGTHYGTLKERNAEARRLRAEGWSVDVSTFDSPFDGGKFYMLEAWQGDRRPDLVVSDRDGTRYGWTT
jgi:hypothetical protein